MKLNSENVHNTFLTCLFKEGEPTDSPAIGEGVMMKIGFNPERLDKHKPTVAALLDELPDNFKAGKGGGWSFLNMCVTRDDEQWADMHRTVDELVCLGTATKLLSFLMPRDMWGAFPGGMPYIVVQPNP